MTNESFIRDDELYIVHLLEVRHRVTVQELCDALDLAPSTIRKKLADMESRNLLIRSHGGAVSVDTGRDDPVSSKALINTHLKKAIAAVASGLLKNNQTIILAGGSTVTELSHYLVKLRAATIFTNSFSIAATAMQNHNLEVHMNGGIVRARSACLVGPDALKFYRGRTADIAFIGCDSFNEKSGAGLNNILVAELEQQMMKCAKKRYILCDSSKLKKENTFQLLAIKDMTGLITDNDADPAYINLLQERGLEVIVAPVTHTHRSRS